MSPFASFFVLFTLALLMPTIALSANADASSASAGSGGQKTPSSGFAMSDTSYTAVSSKSSLTLWKFFSNLSSLVWRFYSRFTSELSSLSRVVSWATTAPALVYEAYKGFPSIVVFCLLLVAFWMSKHEDPQQRYFIFTLNLVC
eukprot:TRINITY_DN6418_c0_g1_i1.p2 TRINITY_DN6418_c0_g1~~TRINITY_DN6418_c0_g1_i1.p2  ORF type:complete len:144 (+),score=18.70 TRINITY_DN6418_c0_g1_i1:266-697(+)